MKKDIPFLAFTNGMVLGTGFLYFLDPRSGDRRRARLRDRAIHLFVKSRKFLASVQADGRARMHGWKERLRSRAKARSESPVDNVLVERVRAKLGKHVSHPGSLKLEATSGKVVMSGPILESEAEEALRTARRVPGVREVENCLEVHQPGESIPGLQGQSWRSHERPEVLRARWSPALRVAAGGLGLLLIARGARRRRVGRVFGLGSGSALFLRSLRNKPLFFGRAAAR